MAAVTGVVGDEGAAAAAGGAMDAVVEKEVEAACDDHVLLIRS